MSLGVRGKLFVVSLLLIIIVGFSSGAYLESQLRAWLLDRLELELLRYAATARELVERTDAARIESIDPVADRLGVATSARVTIIARDGRVLGDSELALSEVRRLENHGDRPEVLAAFQGTYGVAQRFSSTVKTLMLYVAVPYGGAVSPNGVTRVAMPLTEMDKTIGELRFLLVVAGLLGLVVAVVMSGLASHLATRSLRAVVDHVREITNRAGRTNPGTWDEIAGLAGSFNHLANELERHVKTLGRERDQLKAILECMSEALFALDDANRIVIVNKAALTLLERREPPVGQTLAAATGIAELGQLVDSARERKQVVTAEVLLPKAPARVLLVHAVSTGEAARSVVVMHDITEIRRLEKIRREFISNASHELRTPVTIIRANAETLLDGAFNDPDAAPRLLNALDRSAQRLVQMIDDLLDLSRLDAGRYPLNIEPVSVFQVVTRSLEALGERARISGIRLRNEVAPRDRVSADSGALEQIVNNLVENAVKFTPKNGNVVVRLKRTDGQIRIEVEDNGPGIEPRHRDRLFERFYRVDSGRSREIGGTGLGLAIVKHLAEAMRGGAGMEPVVPNGSLFWVTLPSAGESTAGRPISGREEKRRLC